MRFLLLLTQNFCGILVFCFYCNRIKQVGSHDFRVVGGSRFPYLILFQLDEIQKEDSELSEQELQDFHELANKLWHNEVELYQLSKWK